MCEKLGWVLEHEQDNNPDSFYVKNCRELVDMMLDFLDGIEEDPDLEPTLGFMNGPPETDECEIPEDAEPSLGSFDRMLDQEKAWKQVSSWGVDYEQDDCDAEPSLGSVSNFAHSDQDQWAAGKSNDSELDDAEAGIGDQDGLDEQVPFRDWQNVGMV